MENYQPVPNSKTLRLELLHSVNPSHYSNRMHEKIVTKIVGNRMSQIISKHNILHGPNYAGLKNEDTSTPIHIINGLMEEAKENKDELWLIFQDMAKAYDSIGLTPLTYAL